MNDTNNNKLILFDFDGTLCDSASTIVKLMKKTCLELNLVIPDDKIIRNNIGYGVMKSALIYTDNNFDLAKKFSQRYLDLSKIEYMGEINQQFAPLFPGAIDCLAKLKKFGFKLGITTNKSRSGLDTLLIAHDLKKFFDNTMTANDCNVKPSPEMIDISIERLNVKKNDTLLIGDTSTDANCAKNAKIKFVGVNWGYNDKEILIKNGAIKIIKNFDNLPDYIFKLFSLKSS